MTYSKVDVFSADMQEIAKLCKVLSHPARLAILKYLSDCKSCISGDISNEIPLSRTTVSRHLQELKKAGFIIGEIDGVKINYCICYKIMEKHSNLIKDFLKQISTPENFLSCCENPKITCD
ncbi:MAG: winged helix-turn-helix transcriptional regulator [Bacteroidetes bacterium]|nr:winged helix-turn-helix transcriptional regulator [Bacteroidota bacterium]MBL6942814.1 winged helix-turn-helix transcriptional regulator [Bacteroidales bacterium]